MNSIISSYGLRYEAYNIIYYWIGQVAVIKGVIHVILTIVSQTPNLYSLTQVAVLVVSPPPLKRGLLTK
jgi:hypothetical protein